MSKIVGLDLGIASVGWAVIDTENEQILGRGVRIFQSCENPKDKTSLAVPRRLARGTRRRLARRANRMKDLKRFLVSEGFCTEEELLAMYVPKQDTLSPYQLRYEGLNRKLDAQEWARVLTQLCKRRGYKSMRLSDAADDETGKVKTAIAENDRIMHEKGYRTIGEMFILDEKFKQHIRNKGAYDNIVTREMVLSEIDVLFKKQNEFGNPLASDSIKQKYIEILQSQKKILEGNELIKLVGNCTFFDGRNDTTAEKRAPQACFTYEKFRFLQKVTNIRWSSETRGETIGLAPEQIEVLLNEALAKKGALTYKNVRKLLSIDDSYRFAAVRPKDRKSDEAYFKEEGNSKLPLFKVYHDIEDVLEKRDLADEWARISNDADILDAIGVVLTYYKYAESVEKKLLEIEGITPEMASALTALPAYSKNGHLSIKAMRQINEGFLQGLRYDEAVLEIGFHHSHRTNDKKSNKLPAINKEDIVNPVVIRTMSQTRKVINAIIDAYGAFDEVHIEFAREMNKSKEERSKMEQEQKERGKKSEARLKKMVELGITHPRPIDIVKYRLIEEQGCQCAYSGKHIDITRFNEDGYIEIDHILPYSRSFNNSLDNRVAVLTDQNQSKGPRTPWEWKNSDTLEWARFESWVLSSGLSRRKKENLLTKTFSENEEGFRDRNLNDTRYAARYLKQFIEDNLEFTPGTKIRVVPVNGGVTSYLRNAWQLNKDRDNDGDRHHAQDALVIAATNSSMIQKVGTFYGKYWLKRVPDEVLSEYAYYDAHTGELLDKKHVPEPWPHFADQVRVWMAEDPVYGKTLGHCAKRVGKSCADCDKETGYEKDCMTERLHDPSCMPPEERAKIKPMFVSRMPRRKVTGAAHKETIKSRFGFERDHEVDAEGNIIERKSTGRLLTTKKMALTSLAYDSKKNTTNFENMLGKDKGNKNLYDALVARLKEHDGKGDKAFKEPFYRPTKNGKQGPIVRSITVIDEPMSGWQEVNGGIAALDSMIRIDVFSKPNARGKEQFYIVPIYVRDTVKKELPNKAIVAFKAEENWIEMDDTYSFIFSLYPDDLIKYGKGEQAHFGYYTGCDRSVAGILIIRHDRLTKHIQKVGVKNLDVFEKYEVDILGGSVHKVKSEKRKDFSEKGKRHDNPEV